ncbi:carboxypeptidase regulatory-like domain-containing protein [Deferrisoma camini]|uniref:carboxypeptidase regulatory-like domain-containing protein n=1 Tax=Deferrisoma camini TaxID=1035120 RepID=UPI00046CFA4F|nr:carboxypeptidase regulatory-like domain-containing protein [Deferrisoma camini]
MSGRATRMGVRWLVAVAAAVGLTGIVSCGGGGGGGGAGESQTVSFEVSGQAFDGPLAGATVVVRKPDGTELATATTGQDGTYSIEVKGYEGPFLVEVSGGTDLGPDGTGGTADDTANTARFEDIGYGTNGATVLVAPNPVFTMARGFLANGLAGAGRDAVAQARQQAAQVCGLEAGDLRSFPSEEVARRRIRALASLAKMARTRGKSESVPSFLQELAAKAGNLSLFSENSAEWSETFRSQVLGAVGLSETLAQQAANAEARQASRETGMLVSGAVRSLATGAGVAGATVTVEGLGVSTVTDGNGAFALSVPVDEGGEQIKLTVRANGYAENQKVFSAVSDGGANLVVVLKPVTVMTGVSLSGLTAGRRGARMAGDSLVLESPDGSVRVNIPFRSLRRSMARHLASRGLGDQAAEFTAEVTYGDPLREKEIFPGSFRAKDSEARARLAARAPRSAFQGAEDEVSLESVAFVNIRLKDEQGNEIPELDEPMTVRLRIPDGLQARYLDLYNRGQTVIPWYSYDEEQGIWVREGEATLVKVAEQGQEVMYAQAQAEHFSWWNVDWPIITHACIDGTVQDADGNVLAGAWITAEGVNYQGASDAITDAEGNFLVRVRRDAIVRVFVTEQENTAVEVDTGAGTQDSCGEGVPLYHAGILTLQRARITGRVVWAGSDPAEPIQYVTVRASSGAAAVTGSDGTFEVPAPSGEDVTLVFEYWDPDAWQSVRATRTVEGANGEVDLGDVALEQPTEWVTLEGTAYVRTGAGTDDETTEPARWAYLNVAGYETWTDGNGRYSVMVPRAQDGVYEVSGWVRWRFDLTTQTQVTKDEPDVYFDVHQVTLLGTVLVDDGAGPEPAAGAEVWTDTGAYTTTDENGGYEVQVVAGVAAEVTVAYYDGVSGQWIQDSQEVVPGTEDTQEGPSFVLQVVRPVRVTGRVTFGAGCPAAWAGLLTYEQGWTSTDGEGRYEVYLPAETDQKIFVVYGDDEVWTETLNLFGRTGTVAHDIQIEGVQVPPSVEVQEYAASVVAGGTWRATLVVRRCGTDPFTYRMSADGVLESPATGDLVFTDGEATVDLEIAVPESAASGWHEFRFEVLDADDNAVAQNSFWVQIRAADVNEPPRVEELMVAPSTVMRGQEVEAWVYAWDPDWDGLTFAWTLERRNQDGEFESVDVELGGDAYVSVDTGGREAGVYRLTVAVSDGAQTVSRSAEFEVVEPTPVVWSVVADRSQATEGDEVCFVAYGRNLSSVSWTVNAGDVVEDGNQYCHTVTSGEVEAGELVVEATAGGSSASARISLYRDADGDGLSAARESELGTSDTDPDSDDDGLTDSAEVERGTNPLAADSDGDGLSDGTEVAQGTDPLNDDTDYDGIKDGEDEYPRTPMSSSFGEAKAYLEAGDVAAAHAVLAQMDEGGTLTDPARVLYALTTVMTVAEEAKDSASPFYALLDALGLQVVGDTLQTYDFLDMGAGLGGASGMGRSARLAAATTAEQYRAAAEEALDRVVAAGALLDAVTGPVSFTVTIEGAEYEVDDADVELLGAALDWCEFLLQFALAYDYTHDETRGPVFSLLNLQDLVLRSDAADRMAAAKQAFVDAIDGLEAAHDAMAAETDDQSDDLLTLVPELEGYWPYLTQTLDALVASAEAAGFTPVPFWQPGEEEFTSFRDDPDTGETIGTARIPLYLQYLSIDLSALFDEPFDGAGLADDVAAGLVSVTFTPWTGWDGSVYYDQDTRIDGDSYLAGFIASVVEDVEFPGGGVEAYLWAGPSGPRLTDSWEGGPATALELVEMGRPDLVTRAGYTAERVVLRPVAKLEGAAISVDGDDSDWTGVVATPLGAFGEVAQVEASDGIYLLIRSPYLYAGSWVSLSFGRAGTAGVDRWVWGIEVWSGGAYVWGLPEEGVESAVGDGVVELFIPSCALALAAGDGRVFVHEASAWGEQWDASDVTGWPPEWILGYSLAVPPCSAAGADTDGDGLTDDQESWIGSDPNAADTDGDGLSDYDEVMTYGTSPSSVDSDWDGYSDNEEVAAGADPNDWESTPENTGLRFGFTYLQYRNHEDPSDTYSPDMFRAWADLRLDGSPVSESDIAEVEVLDSADNPVTMNPWQFWGDSGHSYYSSGGGWRLSDPWINTGVYFSLPDLPRGTYTLRVTTTDGRVGTYTINFPGQVVLPYVRDVGYEWTSRGLRVTWTNPTADPNWGQVDRIMVVLLDPDWGDVLYIPVDPTQESFLIPANVLETVAEYEQFPALKLQIQTRAYDEDNGNLNYARGYAKAVDIPWAWNDPIVSWAYMQYRNYPDDAKDGVRAWIEFEKAGDPLGPEDFRSLQVEQPSGSPVPGGAWGDAGLDAGDYLWLSCSGGECYWDGTLRTYAGFFWTLGSSLEGGLDYTFTGQYAGGGSLDYSLNYPGDVVLPLVTNLSSERQADGGVLLTWSNPVSEPNWGEVDQLRIVVLDMANPDDPADIVYAWVPPDQEYAVLPPEVVTQIQAMGTGPFQWIVQTRAYDDDGHNYARGYSEQADLNLTYTEGSVPTDTDGDGLSDYEEITEWWTVPTNPDSDGDGLTDGDEVNVYGTQPTVADTDGDGVTDGEEVNAGTDPMAWGERPSQRLSSDFAYVQYRNYEDSSRNGFRAWISLMDGGVFPQTGESISYARLEDSSGAFVSDACQFVGADYVVFDPTEQTTDEGRWAGCWFDLTGMDLVPGSYRFKVTDPDGGTLVRETTMPEVRSMNFVSSASMTYEWQPDGSLTLSWTEPEAPNYDELRLVFRRPAPSWVDFFYVLHLEGTNSVTIPADVVELLDSYSPVSEGWLWEMQGRAWTDDGDNYARSYSNPVMITTEDQDGDGISDDEEMSLGTDPVNPDTDGDKVGDGLELTLGTDPLDDTDPGGWIPTENTELVGIWELRDEFGTLKVSVEFNQDGSFVIDHEEYGPSEAWYHEEGSWSLAAEGIEMTWSSSTDPDISAGSSRILPAVLLPDGRLVLDLWILLSPSSP